MNYDTYAPGGIISTYHAHILPDDLSETLKELSMSDIIKLDKAVKQEMRRRKLDRIDESNFANPI